jgi:uncharacterized protein (DUF433 family)
MPLSLQADIPPLVHGADGVICVGGSRIPLERVIRAFIAGMTPEQIVQDFQALTLEDVYATINYYLHHREEVDAYLRSASDEASRMREEVERQFDPTGIAARLLARHSAKAT